MSETRYDYIIVGGGLAGCTLVGRLSEKIRSLRILIIRLVKYRRPTSNRVPARLLRGGRLARREIPMDGTHIASAVLGMATTSQGRITLASTDATTAPLIDPNYYAAEFERAVRHAGIRQVGKLLLETPEGQDTVEAEAPHPGFEALGAQPTDEQIDARVKAGDIPSTIRTAQPRWAT
ncbi:hypothetical protein BDW66DRAFT_155859 [Aspergillus desertorum]